MYPFPTLTLRLTSPHHHHANCQSSLYQLDTMHRFTKCQRSLHGSLQTAQTAPPTVPTDRNSIRCNYPSAILLHLPNRTAVHLLICYLYQTSQLPTKLLPPPQRTALSPMLHRSPFRTTRIQKNKATCGGCPAQSSSWRGATAWPRLLAGVRAQTLVMCMHEVTRSEVT